MRIKESRPLPIDSDTWAALSRVDRRDLLKGAAAAVAFAGLSRLPARAQSGGTLNTKRFLVTYLTGGYTQAAYDECVSLGYSGYLDKHLSPGTISDTAWDNYEAQYPPNYATKIFTAARDPQGGEQALYFGYNQIGGIGTLAVFARIGLMLRSIMTQRQALDTLAEYWTQHHFSVYGGDIANGQPYLYLPYVERIRGACLNGNLIGGTFANLLRVVAQSSSMLQYLNNADSVAGNPNENYARELLELHTIGLKADLFDGVTCKYEDTIKEVARVLTGWSYDHSGTNQFGHYKFKDAVHDHGTKVICFLPQTYTGTHDDSEGLDLLNRLAGHWAAQWYLAYRMVAWFLRDLPPYQTIDNDDPARLLVNRIAAAIAVPGATFNDVLRALFDESQLTVWAPHQNALAMTSSKFFRWPIRALNLQVQTTSTGRPNQLVDSLLALGSAPGDVRPPNGYRPGIGAQQDSMVGRWSHAFKLAQDTYDGLIFDDVALAQFYTGSSNPTTAQFANQKLTGGLLTTQEVNFIQSYYNALNGVIGYHKLAQRDVIALTLCAPSAQYQNG
jgi:uncharacterized protein (DUF1800 family)